MNYTATFPLLLNIADQPSYFMALKDAAGLVKMYAMVNVSQYRIVATGATVADCESNYRVMLARNGLIDQSDTDITPSGQGQVTGVIAGIRSAVVEGNTWYYLVAADGTVYYAISVADDKNAVILSVGDNVTVTITEGEDKHPLGLLRDGGPISICEESYAEHLSKNADWAILHWIQENLRLRGAGCFPVQAHPSGEGGPSGSPPPLAMLATKKYRKYGLCLGLRLVAGLLICNIGLKSIVAGPPLLAGGHRPAGEESQGLPFPSGHTWSGGDRGLGGHRRQQKIWLCRHPAGSAAGILPAVSVCAFSIGCTGRRTLSRAAGHPGCVLRKRLSAKCCKK